MDAPRVPSLVPRHATALITQLMSESRVVVVNGPRQAGKTTQLRQLHEQTGGQLSTFDDPRELAAAQADPVGYIESTERPLYLDEVQRAGDSLLLTIKMAVDRDEAPGSFILSGSTRFLTVPTLSESLAGRAAVVDLWQFSVAERRGRRPVFIDALLTEPDGLAGSVLERLTRHEYMQLVCTGGFPTAVTQASAASRGRWFSSYLRTVTSRDIRDIARIHRLDVLPRAMRLLAAVTAQELNAAELSRRLGLDEETARSYVPLLETVYLIQRLPAWSRNLSSKVARRPKIHLTDSGMAAWLQRQSPDSLARPGNPAAGALLETFVLNELTKLAAVSAEDVELLHFRERAGREVDCILETPDGKVAAVEVKAAATVNLADFKHVAFIRDKVGDDFIAGVVLYTGQRALRFGDRLLALPVSALWAS